MSGEHQHFNQSVYIRGNFMVVSVRSLVLSHKPHKGIYRVLREGLRLNPAGLLGS